MTPSLVQGEEEKRKEEHKTSGEESFIEVRTQRVEANARWMRRTLNDCNQTTNKQVRGRRSNKVASQGNQERWVLVLTSTNQNMDITGRHRIHRGVGEWAGPK